MDIQELKQIIKLVEKSDIGELELEEDGLKIRIAKNNPSTNIPNANGVSSPVIVQSPAPAVSAPAQPIAEPAPAAEANTKSNEADADKYHEIRSPMVGTFYRSPSPDSPPYVEVGDQITVGAKMCIIEAMKLMNEIESEFSGRIAKILVDNSQPVEFNQVLFLIEK